ncbi:unnamed protein product [Periconia digitata]|uniref:Methyltransferase domain-containing protein n=1 Tax=Periconia digitata TaxID=1303443 RepID=A0A9W4U9W6_9PLEO|nr:unnamed protein product [Periconia digitata]
MIRSTVSRYVHIRQLTSGVPKCEQVIAHRTRNPISLTSVISSTSYRNSKYKTSYHHSQNHSQRYRTIHNTPRTMAPTHAEKPNDWSAQQYLKFDTERTRPVYDLVGQIASHLSDVSSPRIYDLGCGPGNSSSVLLSAFPGAKLTGMDNSPDMLLKARSTLPDAEFVEGDLSSFAPGNDADLIFSNAAIHWLRSPQRIPSLVRMFEGLKKGGILAFQIPDNYTERSHALMRTVALTPSQPWSQYFADARVGDLQDSKRPDLDPIEAPSAFYNAFASEAATVNIWRTTYQHVLKDVPAIVEWVKGTGLQPFLHLIPEEEARKEYVKAYERELKNAYPELVDGKVLLAYPRLFVLAVKS